ncbi:pentapeptide repeat-containing protein, partial [Spirillospora sp. NPDC047418]
MVTALATAVAAIWITTAWLLGATDDATVSTDRARVRVEAVRTGLAAGAGAGAAVGLLLAFRRQAHQEHDTAERRITDMYSAAAEQLASEKAPVRLTALYTLERLANDNPPHRQTIVNIICAYLRMPFTAPPNSTVDRDKADNETFRRHALRYRATCMGQAAPVERHGPDPYEESQVRDTAQGILSAHLHPTEGDVFWPDISLDLIGATLTNSLNLTGCIIRSANFRRATFIHGAFCNWVTFTGAANFVGATFTGPAKFDETTFGGVAYFRAATFTGSSFFQRASFAGHVNFDELEGGGELSWMALRWPLLTWDGRMYLQQAGGSRQSRAVPAASCVIRHLRLLVRDARDPIRKALPSMRRSAWAP